MGSNTATEAAACWKIRTRPQCPWRVGGLQLPAAGPEGSTGDHSTSYICLPFHKISTCWPLSKVRPPQPSPVTIMQTELFPHSS